MAVREEIDKAFEEDFKKLDSEYEAKKKSLDAEKGKYLRRIEVIEKYEKEKPKNITEFQELCSVLCFNDLIFCCKPKARPCMWRSAVLKILGISDEEFIKKKEELSKQLVKFE